MEEATINRPRHGLSFILTKDMAEDDEDESKYAVAYVAIDAHYCCAASCTLSRDI